MSFSSGFSFLRKDEGDEHKEMVTSDTLKPSDTQLFKVAAVKTVGSIHLKFVHFRKPYLSIRITSFLNVFHTSYFIG